MVIFFFLFYLHSFLFLSPLVFLLLLLRSLIFLLLFSAPKHRHHITKWRKISAKRTEMKKSVRKASECKEEPARPPTPPSGSRSKASTLAGSQREHMKRRRERANKRRGASSTRFDPYHFAHFLFFPYFLLEFITSCDMQLTSTFYITLHPFNPSLLLVSGKLLPLSGHASRTRPWIRPRPPVPFFINGRLNE